MYAGDYPGLDPSTLAIEPEPLVISVEHFTRAGLRDLEKAAAPAQSQY